MTDETPRPPVGRTTADVQALLAAERGGQPFLTWSMHDGSQGIFVLPRDRWRLTVGRNPESDLPLDGDVEISRAHALLEQVGNQWTLVDDGLSSNGSFVNGKRVFGRQRLSQGDRLCIGKTLLLFRDPGPRASATTRRDDRTTAMPLTPTHREVLVALCRPLQDNASSPATNKQIAAEVSLSVDAVKAHMRQLFDRFGLTQLPQNEKRARLAQKAFASGAVAPRDF